MNLCNVVFEQGLGGEWTRTLIAEPLPTVNLSLMHIPITLSVIKPVRVRAIDVGTDVRLKVSKYMSPIQNLRYELITPHAYDEGKNLPPILWVPYFDDLETIRALKWLSLIHSLCIWECRYKHRCLVVC